jgi:hypothetical protein
MKNLFKVFGIIALAALIGFSMAACGFIDVPVSEVTLNKSSISLAVGGTETLTATVSPSDATNKTVGWSSSNNNVATVTYGTVTAVATGTATITVTTADGGKTAQCTVTVIGSTTPSLEGVWANSSGTVEVTVSGNAGVFSYFGTLGALSQSAKDKGFIKIGNQYWKSLTSTGNLTWSGQVLLVNNTSASPNVATGTSWTNGTFILSADGQTLTVTFSETVNSVTNTVTGTWTRKTTYSLDGIWENNGVQTTVNGTTGVITAFGSSVSTLGQSAIDKGYVKIGTTQYWRNITSTGNLTWSGQELMITYNNSSPNVATGTTYDNRTFTLSADGQTLTVTDGTNSTTWTRSTYSLDGVWVTEKGMAETFSGSNGVLSSFTSPLNAFSQDAISKGYLTLGMQNCRNLTSTGTLKWSGQYWSAYYNNNNPNVAVGAQWFNCTITMSADGQTITLVIGSTTNSDGTINGDSWTMTRKQ